MKEGARRDGKATTVGNRLSGNLYTVDSGCTESEELHHGRVTELKKRREKGVKDERIRRRL